MEGTTRRRMNIFSKVWGWLSYKPPVQDNFSATRLVVMPDYQTVMGSDHLYLNASDNTPKHQALIKKLLSGADTKASYKLCTNCHELVNKNWLYDHCYKCCKTVDSWSPEALAAASCEEVWPTGPQIGETALAKYDISINIGWIPESWHVARTDLLQETTELRRSDRLLIVSRPMQICECPFLIFKVRDRNCKDFYLSAQYIEKVK